MSKYPARDAAGKARLLEVAGTYGRWSVLRRGKVGPSGEAFWLCRCGGCGEEYEVAGHRLVSGDSTQCDGCARKLHGKSLTERIWPRVCRTCELPFTGTARQVYCDKACRPRRTRVRRPE